MKKALLILILFSSYINLSGQPQNDPYVDCLNRYLEYKTKIKDTIKKRTGFGFQKDTILVRTGNFFDKNRLNKNIKLLSEQEITNESENENVFNLIEIRPIIFENGYMYIHIRDVDVSKNGNENFYMLKGGGVYKLKFKCNSEEFEIITVSQTI